MSCTDTRSPTSSPWNPLTSRPSVVGREMRTQVPFSDAPVLQKLLQHQTEALPDVRELRPDVPDALASVLSRMLAKRPEDRYQRATDVIEALTNPPARRPWWKRLLGWTRLTKR